MYCTVCLRVLQTPFNQVLDQLDSQFQENIDNRKYLRDVYSYVRGKSYNSRSTDLFLEAFSRLYKFMLIVIDSEEDIDELGEENLEKVVRLHQSKDHFDLQGDREEYISLEQEEVANVNSRIPKC